MLLNDVGWLKLSLDDYFRGDPALFTDLLVLAAKEAYWRELARQGKDGGKRSLFSKVR